MSAINRAPIELRPARMDDAALLLHWRNEEMTRRFSIETAPVVESEHVAWLRDSLANPRRHLLIALQEGKEVGTLRLDYGANDCTLSWTVAPEARGRGVGADMVGMILDNCPRTVRAFIKSDNHASIRIAERAGMSLERRKENLLLYVRAPSSESVATKERDS